MNLFQVFYSTTFFPIKISCKTFYELKKCFECSSKAKMHKEHLKHCKVNKKRDFKRIFKLSFLLTEILNRIYLNLCAKNDSRYRATSPTELWYPTFGESFYETGATNTLINYSGEILQAIKQRLFYWTVLEKSYIEDFFKHPESYF